MKDKRGVNYRPIFKIIDWVNRPPELPNIKAVSGTESNRGPNPSGSTTPSPPPEPRRKPDPDDEPLF